MNLKELMARQAGKKIESSAPAKENLSDEAKAAATQAATSQEAAIGKVVAKPAGILASLNKQSSQPAAVSNGLGKPNEPGTAGHSAESKEVALNEQAKPTQGESPAPKATGGAGGALAFLNKNLQRQGDSATPAGNVSGSGGISTLELPALEQEVVPDGPAGFQHRLDRLDQLIIADSNLSPLILDSVKKRIMEIFKELAAFPEYDGLIIDRDVHNIMAFMQKSVSKATESTEKAMVKRTDKAKKKAAPSKFDFDLDGLETLMIASTTLDVNAIGNLNVDDIVPKSRR